MTDFSPRFIFPNGTHYTFMHSVTGLDIMRHISASRMKTAVAIRVQEEIWDLTRELPHGSHLDLVTRDTAEGLEIIRHDTAHVLAQAIKMVFPETQITIGPSIEHGFYYDVWHPTKTFTPDDLEILEAKMHAIIDADHEFVREIWNRDDAIRLFLELGEPFKAELIQDIPADVPITLYRQGDFIDLCRGPHMPSTRYVGHAFRLTKVSGSYWRGDPKKTALQRIYGTAWNTQVELDEYLFRLEEAQKRDHRKLGQDLQLFHIQDEAVGSVFWHPKGWTLYRVLEQFMRHRLEAHRYVEVRTPQLVDRSLWEASGHWEKFREHMFTVEAEERVLAVKPMNCPCHVQIFKKGIRSYRDLPLRMAEFGSCHRYEPSGALHGLMRVRSFVQDDAHIFCTPGQIISETLSFCELLKGIYRDLGFESIHIKFSDRPIKRAGTDAIWDQAESALREASEAANLAFTLNPGEGAFYGPKLEFVLKDSLGREWQCGTLQVDFVLPERLQAYYVDEDGIKKHPVMLHRAILGSFERFIGVLIENYAGKFPQWMAPVQVVVATITDATTSYGKDIVEQLRARGIRVESDWRNEKISYKIREHSLQKIPSIWVVGAKEADAKTVAIRTLGQTEQTLCKLDEALQHIELACKPPSIQ
jgi:threonyl-tRNA synthetase